jgi:hypothetical protein
VEWLKVKALSSNPSTTKKKKKKKYSDVNLPLQDNHCSHVMIFFCACMCFYVVYTINYIRIRIRIVYTILISYLQAESEANGSFLCVICHLYYRRVLCGYFPCVSHVPSAVKVAFGALCCENLQGFVLVTFLITGIKYLTE